MKVFFIVQGEGRGHLTQALSLLQLLSQNGHEVCAMAIGGENQNLISCEIGRQIPIYPIKGPSLSYGHKSKGLSVSKTILRTFKNSPTFVKEVKSLKQLLKHHQPDLVINFYEILAGLYKLSNPQCKVPFVSIAHQYLLQKPNFIFPQNSKLAEKLLLNANSNITAIGSELKLALSLDRQVNYRNIIVVPPLIRNTIKESETCKKGFILVYLTHSCMLPQLIDWKIKNPNRIVHCFVSRKNCPQLEFILDGLCLHQPDSKLFLKKLRTCDGLATTAGFESVAEAVYLQKPLLMVPVKGHFEQKCNATDAKRFGAGQISERFDLDLLELEIDRYKTNNDEYRSWLKLGENKLLRVIENVALKVKEI